MGGDRDDAPEDQAAVIQIELRLDGSMPAGIATAPGGAARGFTGWMGLMSAVDALSSGNGNETAGDDEA
ncbi:MAG: hypothetical protein JWO02_3210 [Solirubrobacterales bacterium]|nr:hypothetical protein [Solirubrobacterales bacterium]